MDDLAGSYWYGGAIAGASIAAPCAVTHSISMNQQVVFLVSRVEVVLDLVVLGAAVRSGVLGVAAHPCGAAPGGQEQAGLEVSEQLRRFETASEGGSQSTFKNRGNRGLSVQYSSPGPNHVESPLPGTHRPAPLLPQ